MGYAQLSGSGVVSIPHSGEKAPKGDRATAVNKDSQVGGQSDARSRCPWHCKHGFLEFVHDEKYGHF